MLPEPSEVELRCERRPVEAFGETSPSSVAADLRMSRAKVLLPVEAWCDTLMAAGRLRMWRPWEAE